MFKKDFAKKSIGLMMVGTMLSVSAPAVLAETQMHTQVQTQACPGCPMQQMDQQMMMRPTAVQQQTHVIPAGTSMTIRMIGATPATTGSVVTGQLINPLVVNGVTILPAGSTVRGTVTAVNPATGAMNIQFQEVASTTGETIPIRTSATVAPLQGRVITQRPSEAWATPTTLFPRVTIGREEEIPPAGRVLAGTVGGALFGGATGTLVGLTMPAVYGDDIDFSEGTGALRGLGWGAAYGAGLGLLSGMIAAAADRDEVAVTTVGAQPVTTRPLTNISTGSATEIPVAYTTTPTVAPMPMPGATDYILILDQPVNVTL